MNEIIELESKLCKIKSEISYLSAHTQVKNQNHWATQLIKKLENDIYNFSDEMIKLKNQIDYQKIELENKTSW